MAELREIISVNIGQLRRKAGLTQMELAEKLNYSDKAVSKWERGETVPDVATVKELADLFSVTVDYLLSADHSSEEEKQEYTKRQKRNQVLIATMSGALVWLVAVFAYINVALIWPSVTRHWLAFVYAVPVCSIVLLVFACLWGERKWRFWLISVLMWSTLGSVYLTALPAQLWLIFFLGIPGQIIILLWAGLQYK